MSSIYTKVLLRIIFFAMLIVAALLSYQKEIPTLTLLLCIGLIAIAVELLYTIKKSFNRINHIVLAMTYEDFSLKLVNNNKNETLFNLQKLYQKLQYQQQQHEVKELVYLNILNSIETGVIILEKRKQTWEIFFMNDYFSNLFDVPKVKSWFNLQRLLPSLTHHLETQNFSEGKKSIDIKIESKEKQTFMLQTSKTQSQNQEYCIILLDSIQNVLDKKEKDTWQNIMKIIAHEIMNSLTPIHSLAHNLQEIITQPEPLSSEDLEDIQLSIQTIVNRTDHLQQFIDNYRKLTMLPSPQVKTINIHQVIRSGLETLAPLFKSKNISIQTNFTATTPLAWDTNQMEQVVINLLTNAIHALDKQVKKEISVHTYEQNNRLFIEFKDSGAGIEEEIKEKIFIPFYTTRQEGAGIGLPLSKNIIEMHNGYITYRRQEDTTCFTLNFPLH